MRLLKAALFFLCVCTVLAQTAQTDQTDQSSSEPAYTGPSVLSRGGAPSLFSFSSIRFRPYVGINAVYDSGLTGVTYTANAQDPYQSSIGAELSYGVSGFRRWRHTELALNFHGDFRHYMRASYFDGSDQSLTLMLKQRLSRRFSFQLNETGGIYNNRFGYFIPAGYYDPLIPQPNAADIFDNRVVFFETMGRLIYQKSARLSFSFGGGGFLVRRRSSALFGNTGYMATSDVAYRLARHLTINGEYGYTHFDFLRIFGDTNMHNVAVGLSDRLSRSWELSLRTGVFRVENLLLAVVPVNPVIAAITGQSSGIAATYNIIYSPLLTARLSHGFQGGTCSVSYDRSVTPGNGVFLTSRQDGAGVDCNYREGKRWALSAGLGYTSLSALEQSVGQYRNVYLHVGASRPIHRSDVSFISNFTAYHDLTRYAAFRTSQHFSASVGVTYSPGERPLSIW